MSDTPLRPSSVPCESDIHDVRVRLLGKDSIKIQKRLYSIKEAAVYLGRSEWAVREMIWASKLPYIKDGRRILLDIRDIDVWIEEGKTRFTY